MSLKKFLRGMAASVVAACIVVETAFAEPPGDIIIDSSEGFVVQESAGSGSAVTSPDNFPVMSGDREITLQDGMRAVFITPGVDIALDEPDLMPLFDEAAGYGMNAVIINTVNEDGDIYSLELGDGDIITKLVDNARYAGLRAYVALDVNSILDRVIAEGGGLKEGFSAAVHKFAMKYICDGILLTNYYTVDTEDMHAEYLRSGSGIGYENWLYETNRYIMRTLSEVICKTTSTTAVGFYIEDMWANSSENELGSDTSLDFQALYDGYCDTKSYIEQGFADFILVRALGSTESEQLKFENVVSWWNSLAKNSGIKAYVCHLNERVGNVTGWYEDQLIKQLVIMRSLDGIGGSAFNSFAALRENKLENTDKLIEFFNDQINPNTVFEELKINSPAKTQFTTTDTSVKFQGSFDPNFDVYFNGEKIQLNEVGTFFIQERLKVGNNYFTIEHKGKKINYVINRYVEIFKSIENTDNITVEGGTRIALSAVVYSGSTVSASVNGKIVPLTEKQASETLDANGSYSEYVGYYTVPDGVIGKEQKLGNITYYAWYEEPGSPKTEKYMTGGTVTVAAKPEPPRNEDYGIEIIDQSSAGTGEVVGKMKPIVTEYETVKYIKTLNDYTRVYDPMTTDNVPSPVFSELPAGTLDYYKSTVGDFVVSTSGKRFRASDVKLATDKGLDENPLVVKLIGNMNGKSFIKINLGFKIGFNVTVSAKYHEQYYGQYGVTSFDAQYVYITFDNVTSVTKLPDFSTCTLFSAGEWETVTENGLPKFRMKLKLRQAGIYSGVAAYYDSDGDLMLTFNVPTPSLAGKVIVIDPGHGYTGKPVFDPGAIGEVTEQEIACAVSKKLEARLTEMGATVIRLNTEEKVFVTTERPKVAIQNDADMYISLHCNSIDNNAQAHGVEVYYFTPFSQPLAEGINDSLAALYDNTIYADGTNSNRGEKYSYYWVTVEQSFPSVLVEMGFVSNKRECLMMANPENQTKMANSIANGILSYFTRSNLG